MWRAPSWSFFSVEGRVDITVTISGGKSPRDVTRFIDIVECATTPSSSLAPFGEITSGSLHLRGWLIQASLYLDTFDVLKDVRRAVALEHNAPTFVFENPLHEFGHDEIGKRNRAYLDRWAYGKAIIDATFPACGGEEAVDTIVGPLAEAALRDGTWLMPLLGTGTSRGSVEVPPAYTDVVCLVLARGTRKQFSPHRYRQGRQEREAGPGCDQPTSAA